MGSSPSKSVGYKELKCSIPGSLVHEEDFGLFYSLCRIESQRTISAALLPSSNQLFFVVISGEVIVQLSSPRVKSVIATTFTAGETIHFFNAHLKGNSGLQAFEYSELGECLRNGDIKLSLSFRSEPKTTARVIGIDRRGMDEFFLRAKCNIHSLWSFANLNIASLFVTSPFFKTMTAEQANIFGILLKIRLAPKGLEVGAHLPPSTVKTAEKNSHSRHGSSRKTSFSSTSQQGHVLVVLQGALLSVPTKGNINSIIYELLEKNPVAKKSALNVLTLWKAPTPSSAAAETPTSGTSRAAVEREGPKLFTVNDLGKPVDRQESNADRRKAHIAIPTGGTIGSDQCWTRNFSIRPRTYLVSTPSVLGYISFAALDVLFHVDARFERVYWRNFYMLVINWVKFSVSFFADMDDWSLALLSCKLSMIGVNAGDVIQQQGAPSEYAYIIMGGVAKETSAPHNDATGGTAPSTPALLEGRELQRGDLFGVMALTTNQPYFSTVVAVEPCLVLRMSKRALDQIYYNNKAKLCEIRIRLMGANVDLLHAIDHPKGGDLFLQYLTRERAAENLTFYRAVDRFDAMCVEIMKLHAQARKLWRRHCDSHPEKTAQGAFLDAQVKTSADTEADASAKADDIASLQQPDGDPERANSNEASPYFLRTPAEDSPLSPPRRLPPISSASNLPTHSGSGSAPGSAKEEDQLKRYSIKVKPAGSTALRPLALKQSSFSQRVAVALAADQDPLDESDAGSIFSAEGLDGISRASSAPMSRINWSTPGAAGAGARASADAGLRLSGTSNTEQSQHDGQAHRSQQIDSAAVDQNAGPIDAKGSQSSKGEEILQTINRLTQDILRGIAELKTVAFSIIETYIKNGAESQLNLPETMRLHCENRYRDWSTEAVLSSKAHATTGNISPNAEASSGAPQAESAVQPVHRTSNAHDALLIPLESIDLSFVELFREAKQEILKLLRDDKFPRWKVTKEFQSFITSVRPYESDVAAREQRSEMERSFDRSVVSLGSRDL